MQLFVDLMKDGEALLIVHDGYELIETSLSDAALRSLVGGDLTQFGPLGRAMLRAGIHSGEYYEAIHERDGLVGFLMTMPPGQDLFSTSA